MQHNFHSSLNAIKRIDTDRLGSGMRRAGLVISVITPKPIKRYQLTTKIDEALIVSVSPD
jgi:hypothetical protein